MSFYTYLLRCEDGSLYTGITTDLVRRFEEHMEGPKKGAKYTASRKPLHYEVAWRSSGRSEASKLEYRIRRLKKVDKEKLAAGNVPACLDLSNYNKVDEGIVKNSCEEKG